VKGDYISRLSGFVELTQRYTTLDVRCRHKRYKCDGGIIYLVIGDELLTRVDVIRNNRQTRRRHFFTRIISTTYKFTAFEVYRKNHSVN